MGKAGTAMVSCGRYEKSMVVKKKICRCVRGLSVQKGCCRRDHDVPSQLNN